MAEASEISENTPASVLGVDSTQRTPDLPESREFQQNHISDMGVIAETDCIRQSSSPDDVSGVPLGDAPNQRCGGALEDIPILTDEDNHSEVMKTPEKEESNMQYDYASFSQLHDSNKENQNRVSTHVSKDSSDNADSVISLSCKRFNSLDGHCCSSVALDDEKSDSCLLISERSTEPIDVRICSDKNSEESRLREQIEVSSEKTMLECSNTSLNSSGITETSTESSEEGCISSSMENLAPSDTGETQHEVFDALENNDNHTGEENATEKIESTKCKGENNTLLESGQEDANSSMEVDVAPSSKSVQSFTSLVDDDKEEGELEEGELGDEDESVEDKEDAPTSKIAAVGKSTSLCVQEKTLKKDDGKKAAENLSADRSHEEGRKMSTSPFQDRKRKQVDEDDGDRERRPNNSNSTKKKKLKHHQHYDSDEEDADGTSNKFRRGPSGPCDFDAMLQQMRRRTGGEEGADYTEEGHYTPSGAHRAGYRPGFGSYDSDAESPAPSPYRGSKRGSRGAGSNRRSPALSSSKTDALCVHFLEGTCTKGDECQYSHNVNHAMVAPSHQRKPELCKFYMIGCCAKRQKCLYMHKDFPCKFYHTGRKCGPPDKCKFSHEPLTSSTRDILLRHIEQAPKDILGSFPRLTKAAAVWVVTITEAGRNKRSCAVDAWAGARDWRGKGFKYVDRALKSLDKKNRRAATATGQDPGGEDVDLPTDDDCVNPNKIPLGNASKKTTVVGQSDSKLGAGVGGTSEGARAEAPVKRGGGVTASSAGEERGSDEDEVAAGRRRSKKHRNRYSGYGGDGYEMEECHKRRHDSHHNSRHRHNSQQQQGAPDAPKFGRNDREHKTDESEEDYENSNNQRRKRNRRSYERDDKLNSKDRLSFRDEDYPVACGVTGDEEQRSLEELMANMPAKQREIFQRVAAKTLSEDGEGKGYSRYKDNVSPTKKYKADGKGQQERLHQQHLTDNGCGGEHADPSGGAHQSQRDDWYSSDDEAHDCSEGKSPRVMMEISESKASLSPGNIAALLESIDRSKKAGGPPSNTGYYNNANFGDCLSGHPSSGRRGVPENLITRSPSSVSLQSQTAVASQQQQQQPPQHYDPFEMFRQQQQHELQKHREQERIKRERMSAATAESSAMHHASQQALSDGSFPQEFFGENRSQQSPSPVNQRIPPGTSSPPSSSYPSAVSSTGSRQEPGSMAGAGCLFKFNINNIKVPSDLAKVLSDLQNQTKLSKSTSSSHSTQSTATSRVSAAPESASRLGPHSLDDGERIARDPRRVRTQRDSSESQDSSDNNRDARNGFSGDQIEKERSACDAQEGSGSSRDSQGVLDPSANHRLFGGLPSARDPRQNRDSREEPLRDMPGKQDPHRQNITDRSKGYPSYRDPRLGGRGTSYDADPRFFPSVSRHTQQQQQPQGSPDPSRIRSNSESSDVSADLTIDIDIKQQSSQHSSMYPGRSNVPFHVPEHDPVTVTNASITAHPPMAYRLTIVTIPKVSYAHITQRMSKDDPRVMEDPRLYRMFFGVQERGGSVSPVANAIPDNPQSPTSENSSPAPESRDPRMNRDPRMSESRNSDPRLITRDLRSSGQNLDPRAADIEITNTDARNLDTGARNADSRNNDPRLESRGDPRLTAPRNDPRMGGNRDPRTNKILEEEPISSDPRVRPGILGPSPGRGMSTSDFLGAAMAPHLGGHLPTSMTPHSVPLLASPINGVSPVMPSNMVSLHGPPPNQGVYPSHNMMGPHNLHRMAVGPNPYNPYTGMAQQPSGHTGLLSLPIGGDQGLLGMNKCFPSMMAQQQQQQQHEGAMPNPYSDSVQHLYQRKKGHLSRDGDGSWSSAGGDGGYTGGHRRDSEDRWPLSAGRHPQDGDGGEVWSVEGHRGGNHDPRLKKNMDTMASFSPIL